MKLISYMPIEVMTLNRRNRLSRFSRGEAGTVNQELRWNVWGNVLQGFPGLSRFGRAEGSS